MSILSDDDPGYISPVSDEMVSLRSKSSSYAGSLVSARKFEITFEVSDLIVVSSTESYVGESIAAVNSFQDETPCDPSTSTNSKLSQSEPTNLMMEKEKGDPLGDSRCILQQKTDNFMNIIDVESPHTAEEFHCYDTVELELVVQEKTHRKPNIGGSVPDQLQNNISSSQHHVEECQSYPPFHNIQNFGTYPDDDSEHSGYISPASSEDDERNKKIRFKNNVFNEYNSTGYVSSISDDMSADDDSIAEEEQILESITHDVFLINIDTVSGKENRRSVPENLLLATTNHNNATPCVNKDAETKKQFTYLDSQKIKCNYKLRQQLNTVVTKNDELLHTDVSYISREHDEILQL